MITVTAATAQRAVARLANGQHFSASSPTELWELVQASELSPEVCAPRSAAGKRQFELLAQRQWLAENPFCARASTRTSTKASTQASINALSLAEKQALLQELLQQVNS